MYEEECVIKGTRTQTRK